MSSASARKEFRELSKIIAKNGYKVVPGGKGGHYRILDSKGAVVVDEHGPVIMSSTPSDFRARDLLAKRLVHAKILTTAQLPWKPEKPRVKETEDGLLLGAPEPDAAKLRAREAERAQSRDRHERTQMVRSRFEPLMSQLGGWTKRGMIAEMADVVFEYNKGAPHAFKAKSTAVTSLQNLRKGGTLSENAALCFEALLDDIERSDSVRDRWFDLVREARGLPPRTVPVFAQPAGSIVDPERPERERRILTPQPGELVRGLEERYSDAEHPVLEAHRNGGVRWNVDFTIDDLFEMNRVMGFFQGLAVQLSVFEGQELVTPAIEGLERIVQKVGEARYKELMGRND